MNKIKALFAACAILAATAVLTTNRAGAVILFGTTLQQQQLVRIDTATNTVTNIFNTAGDPDSLLVDPQFRLIYSLNDVGQVRRYDIGAATDILLASGLRAPQDMTFDPTGNFVLVSNFQGIVANGTISRINLNAAFPNSTLLPLSAVPGPNGIVFDAAGRLFVVGGFGTIARLFQLDPTTGAILKTSAAFDSSNSLDGLVFDPFTGFLFATSRDSGSLYRIDPAAFVASANGTYTPGAPFATGIPFSGGGPLGLGPDGVMTDRKGLLYIASRFDNRVYSCSAVTPNTCLALTPVPGIDDLAQLILDPPVIAKAFSPSTIVVNGVSTLTITVTNPNPTVVLNGVAFTDGLPVGVTVAATPNLTNNCSGGTVTGATAGSTSVGMTGATIAGGQFCTVSFSVTSAAVGSYLNTVSVTSSNGGPGISATATLVVQPILPLTFTKSFAQSTIALNGTSTITFTVTNPNSFPVTNVAISDPLLGGLKVAAGQTSPLTACGGTVTATPGSTSISLAGGALGAFGSPSATCTITIGVVGTQAGGPTNNCATVTSTLTVPTAQACSPLTVVAPPVIVKSFLPVSIPLNGVSTLTFTITNPAANTVVLTGVGFTDNLPLGLVVATPPGISASSCGGTFAPVAGATTITLSGVGLGINSSCTISVNVTGTSAGVKDNSVSVTSTNGGPGNTSTAQLTVFGPAILLKAFGPSNVQPGGISTLSFTISNPNPGLALTGVGFTDPLPVGMAVANPPNLTTSASCGIPPGTVAGATAGSTSITVAGVALAAGAAPCVITVSVTATGAGQLCNTTTTVTSTQAGPGAPATACLGISSSPDDPFQVRYAANLDRGDSIVNVTNTGALDGTDPAGRICVNVYTFDPAEEMVSCCSCLVTPNGVASLSVLNDLVSDQNRLILPKPTSVVIKLLASRPVGGVCNAATPNAANLAPGLRAWGTTLHALTANPPTFRTTETPFARAELSPGELAKLATYCNFIQILGGRRFGICGACQAGARGADRQ